MVSTHDLLGGRAKHLFEALSFHVLTTEMKPKSFEPTLVHLLSVVARISVLTRINLETPPVEQERAIACHP